MNRTKGQVSAVTSATFPTQLSHEGAWDAGALIEARGMTKRYEGFMLQDVSLRVDAGTIVGFVGRNGAGKSTTIKALLGLVSLDGGEARVLGMSPRDIAAPKGALVKEHVGVVFDTVPLPASLRLDGVARIMQLAYRTWDQRRFEELCGRFGLGARKRVKDLSRGMGMKLQLACALSHDARLLILDEATAGLDPMARDEALDVLRDFVADDGHAVLLSSHITSDLEKVADIVCCIDEGRVVFTRPKDDICDRMGLVRLRSRELDELRAAGPDAIPGETRDDRARVLRQDMGVALCVPDRAAFAARWPELECERMGIDDYLGFVLKGELL
ncbi:MAG: ABC transporter ATP-binding protein [Coriobacteriia bacterium]|nr:ABC transporter ATP-binding protein [Coriobacteriia bacterium]